MFYFRFDKNNKTIKETQELQLYLHNVLDLIEYSLYITNIYFSNIHKDFLRIFNMFTLITLISHCVQSFYH
jgi:hypothetical protein